MTAAANTGKLPLEVEFEHCRHITIIYVESPQDAKEQSEDLQTKYEGWCPHCWIRHHTPEQPF